MNRVGKFEKVSFGQFSTAIKDEFGALYGDEGIRKLYDDLQLPTRSTVGSAGYDFKAPIEFTLRPGETIKIPTGIRVKIDEGWWLGCFPSSGLGFKYRLQLDNTVGVIDSDYYPSQNEGHIFAKVTNDSHTGRTISVNLGDAFLQGVFIPFGITYDDDVTGVRNGGMGSTGRRQGLYRSLSALSCSPCA
jgi:dUTP pyrophosphatase